MSDLLKHHHYDVVVIGAGSAGIAAAAAAAKNGARTLLIDAGPSVGGELLTGMTIDGAINARGEWIVGGVLNDLIEELKPLDGYVGAYNDHRLIRYICYDPIAMQIAVVKLLAKSGVKVMLHTVAEEVVSADRRVTGIVIRNKSGRSLVTAEVFIDCSGDGDICKIAGAPYEFGAPDGELQPISVMFRMSGVENEPLLAFVRENTANVALGESDTIREGRTDEELAQSLYEQGQPSVFFKGNGPLLQTALQSGEMFPTALIMIQPTSAARKEVCVNSTRVSKINPLDTGSLGQVMSDLYDQIDICARFLRNRVPGFEKANLAGIAPRLGIRETRRIMGDYVLTEQDVMEGRKFDDGVAKGCHHIDIHQDGINQVRIAVANGGSYDIPFRSLIPRGLDNVMVAGRCFSADRPAHGSARLMGSCMAMGQATGTAGAMIVSGEASQVRKINAAALRDRLSAQGAVIEGTH